MHDVPIRFITKFACTTAISFLPPPLPLLPLYIRTATVVTIVPVRALQLLPSMVSTPAAAQASQPLLFVVIMSACVY